MPPRRSRGFFQEPARAEDEAARQREVEALLAPRRTIVQDVPAERLRPNPFQARVSFAGLEELRDAIVAQGFTSRLRVRPDPATPGVFQLVYGERRLRAARMAGLELIPCEIAEHSDDELLEIGLAENIQRQDLNPLEEARALELFIRERGYSIRRLAERVGKDKGYIENRLGLLRVPEDVQAMVGQRPDSLVAAREIAKIAEPEARAPIIAQVLAGALSTAGVRAIVRELSEPEPAPPPADAVARPAAPASSAQGSRAARPQPYAAATQRLIMRETATIRGILARWEGLAEGDPAARAAIAPAVGELIDLVEQVAESLRRHEGSL